MSTAGSDVRALRGQIREWRRGRNDTPFTDVLSDAYIALFAAAMLGAMTVNLISHARSAATTACTTAACSDVRNLLPWAFALGVVTLTLLLARLFGPLLVSPALGSWMLATPIDRRALLQPRLIVASLLSLGSGALLGASDFTLAGLGAGPGIAFTGALMTASLCAVMFAAIDQAREGRFTRVATWLLAAVVWMGLVLLAVDVRLPQMSPAQQVGPVAILVVVAFGVLAVALTVRSFVGLNRMHRDRLAPGGSLLSNLSGALAGLDPALMYDILLSRRWLDRATVRPVRGGPTGAWALIWRDVIRLRRSLHTLIVLVASVVVPYVAATAGMDRAVTVVGALTGFLAGLGLCSGLRVLARTPGLTRCFPMSASAVRSAGLAVPGAVLVLWGVALSPALHRAMAPISWEASVWVGVAVGLAATTAVARWVTAKPPDYSGQLLTSPMGSIPPGLLGSMFRGFDVLLLLTAPLLLVPSPMTGAQVSIALAGIVLTVLMNLRPAGST